VHPKNAYRALTPVRALADTIDWTRHPMRPLEGMTVRGSAGEPETFGPLVVGAGVGWGKSPSNRYEARPDGTVAGGPVAQTLGTPKRGGDGHELYSDLVWKLDMPRAGEARVRIGDVSTLGRLQLAVDGKVLLDQKLETGEPGQGPWKASKYQEPWKNWVSTYDTVYSVPIPRGRHTLTIANAEGDWIQVRELVIPAYRSSRYPDVDVLGIADPDLAVIWIHDRRSTWQDPYRDVAQPAPMAGLTVTVPSRTSGSWRVEWWDTRAGTVVRSESVTAGDRGLSLSVPTFSRDIAAKVVREP
jgi:hypothetical protein